MTTKSCGAPDPCIFCVAGPYAPCCHQCGSGASRAMGIGDLASAAWSALTSKVSLRGDSPGEEPLRLPLFQHEDQQHGGASTSPGDYTVRRTGDDALATAVHPACPLTLTLTQRMNHPCGLPCCGTDISATPACTTVHYAAMPFRLGRYVLPIFITVKRYYSRASECGVRSPLCRHGCCESSLHALCVAPRCRPAVRTPGCRAPW